MDGLTHPSGCKCDGCEGIRAVMRGRTQSDSFAEAIRGVKPQVPKPGSSTGPSACSAAQNGGCLCTGACMGNAHVSEFTLANTRPGSQALGQN